MLILKQNRQLKDQHLVVAHLARCIANLCDEMSTCVGHENFQNIVPMQGERTHQWMNQLGDMLNSVDAAEEDDEWVDPIFDNARKVFPTDIRERAEYERLKAKFKD